MALVDQKVAELKSFKRTIKAELDLFTIPNKSMKQKVNLTNLFHMVT